jgi:electron transfer flavoprotein beta subunit
MDILVCLKQVPDTTDIKIDPVTNTLKREGVPSIMNPDDKTALEVALTLKDRHEAVVKVVSMGPPQAENILREALAMGADEAYLLTDRMFAGSDTLATSMILAAAIKKIGCDIVLTGRQAIDGDTAQVGPQIAQFLELPQITYCMSVDLNGDEFVLRRQFEDRYQILRCKPPFLATVLSGTAKPRYMNVKGIVSQDSVSVNVVTFSDLDLDAASIGLKGSPTKVKTTFTRQLNSDKQLIVLPTLEAANLIALKLSEKHYI